MGQTTPLQLLDVSTVSARARALVSGRRAIFPILLIVIFLTIYYHDHGIKLMAKPYVYDGPLYLNRSEAHPQPKEFSPFYGGSSTRPIDVSSDPLPLSASLKQRLDFWAAAPGGIHDDGVDLEVFRRWNYEECGGVGHQVDRFDFMKQGQGGLTRERALELRMRLINGMKEFVGSKELKRATKLRGRGIVMVAGDDEERTRVLWNLKMLRSHGTSLPVRVYCHADDLPAFQDSIHKELDALDARLLAVKSEKRNNDSLKAQALIDARFAEVLCLDVDEIPVRNPEYLFKRSKAYKRLGIWAPVDMYKTTAANGIWSIMGVKCRNEWQMGAGSLYIDKRLHTDVLLLARLMLEDKTWRSYAVADKDVFRWAMLMLRKRWGVPGRWVGQATRVKDKTCTVSTITFDSYGEPLSMNVNKLYTAPPYRNSSRNLMNQHSQLPLFQDWPAEPTTARLAQPLAKPLDDDLSGIGDIDCDMLADTDEFGTARAPAKEEIRRRAAREMGISVKQVRSCFGVGYADPRSAERKQGEAEDREKGETWSSIEPDWSNPFEEVEWKHEPFLWNFERKLYGFGFEPDHV